MPIVVQPTPQHVDAAASSFRLIMIRETRRLEACQPEESGGMCVFPRGVRSHRRASRGVNEG